MRPFPLLKMQLNHCPCFWGTQIAGHWGNSSSAFGPGCSPCGGAPRPTVALAVVAWQLTPAFSHGGQPHKEGVATHGVVAALVPLGTYVALPGINQVGAFFQHGQVGHISLWTDRPIIFHVDGVAAYFRCPLFRCGGVPLCGQIGSMLATIGHGVLSMWGRPMDHFSASGGVLS